MIFYRTALFVLSMVLTFTVQSQKTLWVNKMMDGQHSFAEIQEQFNKDWENIAYSRGHGWKQFKRWEYFWSTRLMPDGSFPDYSNGFSSFDSYMSKNVNKQLDGSTWTPLGPTKYTVTGSWSPGLGRVNFIVEDPVDKDVLYVATPGGGIWKSMNNGDSWMPLSDNLAAIGVSSIAVAPTNNQIIYIATGDSDGGDTPSIGVAKSTDGGDNWEIVASTDEIPGTLSDVLVDPEDENIVYIAAREQGVFKSTDGGENWEQLVEGTYRDIEFNPNNSQIIYAAGESDVNVTTDGGANWTPATGIPEGMSRIVLATTPADDSYVYALIAQGDNSYQGLYRSEDSGVSFSERNTTTDCFEGDQAWFDLALAVSPTDKDLLFTGVLNMWKSTDGGSTLEAINSWNDFESPTYTHADIHFIRYYGGNLYCGSDGGIYKSQDDGSQFTDLSEGLQIGQFYRIAGSPNDINVITGGLQDNGNYIKTESTWKNWLGADGMENFVNPNNSNIAYGMAQNGTLYVTEDGGDTHEDISDENLQGAWVTPMSYDEAGERVVVAYNDLYQYDGNWTKLSDKAFEEAIECLELSASDNKIMYFSLGGQIYRTMDNGATVTDITNNLSEINLDENMITSIEVDPTNPLKVWITFGGWTEGVKLATSDDGGMNWSNVSGTLPNLPCNIVKLDATAQALGAIYVGMDIGVYYTDDSQGDFIPFMTNLPKVKVLDIEINESNDIVRIGSYGRGIWESPTQDQTMTSVEDLLEDAMPIAVLFPNPIEDQLEMLVENADFEFFITDLNGRVLHQGKSYHKIAINMSSHAVGSYFVTVFAKGQKQTIKVIKN